MAHVPFPVDVDTDESALTGKITIYCEQEGASNELRALLTELLSQRQDIAMRGDIKRNVPKTPTPGDD